MSYCTAHEQTHWCVPGKFSYTYHVSVEFQKVSKQWCKITVNLSLCALKLWPWYVQSSFRYHINLCLIRILYIERMHLKNKARSALSEQGREFWLLCLLLSIQFWLYLRRTEVCTFMWHWICYWSWCDLRRGAAFLW